MWARWPRNRGGATSAAARIRLLTLIAAPEFCQPRRLAPNGNPSQLCGTTTMTKLLTASHVFICRRSGGVVVLDMSTGKYMGLGPAATTELAAWVHGWPEDEIADQVGADGSTNVPPGGTPPPIVNRLVALGLLTNNSQIGKYATPVRVELASKDLSVEAWAPRERIQFHDLWNLCLAATLSTVMLRCFSIYRIVQHIERRKSTHRGSEHMADDQATRRLVGTYLRLRPLVFTARDACLFDALTMLNFLSRYGQHPKWIFGVRTSPFAAHCWVQHNDFVLNDDPDHIRRFTPIFAV